MYSKHVPDVQMDMPCGWEKNNYSRWSLLQKCQLKH